MEALRMLATRKGHPGMKRGIGADDEDGPDLTVPLKTVCFIIMKAREFDAKEEVSEPDPGSNPTDDENVGVLEDHRDDPVQEELLSFISDLSIDEQIDLVTLMWLGRDDYEAKDWDEVHRQAADAHNEHTAEYLCGEPLVADYLADGLDMIGLSCSDYESGHL
jgi:Protein of unknown function (DUF3775)